MFRSDGFHDPQLLEATQELIREGKWPSGRVIAAVAAAKQAARDLYRDCGLDLPPAEDYVALIIASARHRLSRS